MLRMEPQLVDGPTVTLVISTLLHKGGRGWRGFWRAAACPSGARRSSCACEWCVTMEQCACQEGSRGCLKNRAAGRPSVPSRRRRTHGRTRVERVPYGLLVSSLQRRAMCVVACGHNRQYVGATSEPFRVETMTVPPNPPTANSYEMDTPPNNYNEPSNQPTNNYNEPRNTS
jgi:hypothetical protein